MKRPLVNEIRERVLSGKPVINVLIGPRQVGKTTIALQVCEDLPFAHIYASADSPVPLGHEWIETQWKLAELELQRGASSVLLVLDELQKVRAWSETIKMLWDSAKRQKKDIRLLILGSSALLMQSGLTESLAGRFFVTKCPHWSYSECKTAFNWDLQTWLYFGGYPGASEFIEDEDEWRRYVKDSLIETVIARDVLQMHNISKPTLLRHLFGLCALYPAQVFSYNKMLGQLQDAGNTTTLAHYLELLSSAFLVIGLERFNTMKKRRKGSSPKLVVLNNALINALASKTFAQATSDTIWWGRLVENAVGAYLCSELKDLGYDISYYKEGDAEVDYVVSKGETLWAIEVKSGRAYKTSGMSRFVAKYPKAKVLLIGTGGLDLERFFSEPAVVWVS